MGSRTEIIETLSHRLDSNGSPRREAEARQALSELETGATVVRTRDVEYVIIGEPLAYVAELADGSFERLEARSNSEAWEKAHELSQRVIRLYRDVTRDES